MIWTWEAFFLGMAIWTLAASLGRVFCDWKKKLFAVAIIIGMIIALIFIFW